MCGLQGTNILSSSKGSPPKEDQGCLLCLLLVSGKMDVPIKEQIIVPIRYLDQLCWVPSDSWALMHVRCILACSVVTLC